MHTERVYHGTVGRKHPCIFKISVLINKTAEAILCGLAVSKFFLYPLFSGSQYGVCFATDGLPQ